MHVLIAALQSFYELDVSSAMVCCDNRGALHNHKAGKFWRRTQVGSAQADAFRALRNTKSISRCATEYCWVASHQDDTIPWEELTVEQQLNCMHDALAKSAVSQAAFAEPVPQHQSIPPP